ncbi:hypothetical protein [Flavobacterium sp. I3-2]|uniref:hypothetical protein n=1 Tax=Flavobacterium sp. I3-2 TaxID=2748319 RepID=UPI0015B2E64F|nr:hypothetical protein [Flavobacterium sp. I3-2]
MKTLLILCLFILNVGCNSQNSKTSENEIDIFGSIGPSVKYKEKYYCFFRNYNDLYNTQFTSTFYILNEKGEPESKIEVPDELQTFYYDLYVKNDTIFTTEYNNNQTFYLDFNSKTWTKTKEGSDSFYKDKAFEVYSLDFGEWGSTIWFKDLKTNLQYEMHGHAPIINKIKNIYYVTTENAVYQIENPTKLKKSDKNYNLEKILHDKFYYKEGSFSTLGAKTLIEFDYDEFSDDNTQILTSFVSNDSLFHIYKDSISTKVGFIENQNFIQTHEFSKDIKPLQFYYDWRMPIVNEKQIIQFMTKNEGEFGFIEIKNGKIEIKKFINSNKAPKLSSKDMMDWFKNTFNVYYVGFESLKLKDIDEIEKYIKAVDLAQNRKIDHYLLDNLDKNTIETPRIYSKIELPNHKLYTSYYYKKNNKEIILIQFEWKMDKPNQSFEDYINTKFQSNSINKNRFNELNKYLDNYIGKPINHEKSEYRETITWKKDNKIIELSITDYEVNVTILKNK